MHTVFKRKIKDLGALRSHLVSNGFPVISILSQGSDLYVHHAEGSNPKALIDAYVQPDYYEITSSMPRTQHMTGRDCFVMKSGEVVTFTIIRRSGADDSQVSDPGKAYVTWHGHEVDVTPTEVTFPGGSATVSVGPVPASYGGGWLYVDNDQGEHEHVYISIV